MKQTIVIAGRSPLSYFLAHDLDQKIGNLAHTNLIWLTSGSNVTHLPTLTSLLDSTKHDLSIAKLADVKVDSSEIKSINLPTRRIITARGIIDFDQLIIDQIPSYTLSELKAIGEQVVTLLSSLQALGVNIKAGAARIYCQGESSEAWQLALGLQRDIKHHYPSLNAVVSVLADLPGSHVGDFLRRSGLAKATASNLRLPGLTINEPKPLVSNRQIRGLELGRDGTPHVTAALTPPGHPAVRIFDSAALRQINILRVWRSIAAQVSQQVMLRLENEDPQHLTIASPALLLNSESTSYLAIGEMENRRTKARLVAHLDAQLRRSLAR